MEPNHSLPVKTLFQSFLLISAAYILSLVSLFCLGVLLLFWMYPESYAQIEPLFGPMSDIDKEKLKALIANDPELVFPGTFLTVLMVLNALVCFVLGYLIAWLSPFAKFAHSVFLAVILFVNFFQFAMGSNEYLQTMLILYMATAPISALLGARFYLGRQNGTSR